MGEDFPQTPSLGVAYPQTPRGQKGKEITHQ